MRKFIMILLLAMLTAILSGCIISKTPSTNEVSMAFGDQMTFSIKVFPASAIYTWTLDSTTLSNTGSSYPYTALAGNHTLTVTAKHRLGTDTYTWKIFSNSPPVAHTGPDQTVAEGAMAALDASNSTDPDADIVSYAWEQIGGNHQVVLSNPDGITTTFQAPDVNQGGDALIFKLTVTDSTGLTATTTCIVNVTWTNESPTAVAGSDQTVAEGTVVVLDGASSTDPDDGIASYEWTQIDGPAVALMNADTAQASFTTPDVDPAGAALTFQLTVTDQGGLKSTATCIVNVTWVNAPPIANAGLDQTVSEVTRVTIDASKSSDSDDGIATYDWQQIEGPAVTLSNSASMQPTFTAPDVTVAGAVLKFKLTVTDNGGLKSTATCIVNVTYVNDPPIAEAGPDQTVSAGDLVTLNGEGSSDPDDGIVSYQWQQISGPTVSLTNADSVVIEFTAPMIGSTIIFELTVIDASGLQATDTCAISILPPPWNKIYQSGISYFKSVQKTTDGGYVLAGWAGIDYTHMDALLIKTDTNGNKLWEKRYGGTANEQAWVVRQTRDGGYILGGYTYSYSGAGDAWLIRTDINGNELWDRVVVSGGLSGSVVAALQETSDNGYVLTGNDWVAKTDANGVVQWKKTFSNAWLFSIQLTGDNGYVVAGQYSSDAWLLKIDCNGNKIWDKSFDSTAMDLAGSVQQTSDGGYILAGWTKSGAPYPTGGLSQDVWLIKTDANGNYIWDKKFGGTGFDGAFSVKQINDGGYIIAGYTDSFGAGNQDAWIIKTDGNGNEVWDKTFGGSKYDTAYDVIQTDGGGYAVAAYACSYNSTGYSDALFIKTDAEGNAPSTLTQLQ